MSNKSSLIEKRFLDVLVFSVVVFALIFTNFAINLGRTPSESNPIDILRYDSRINDKEAHRMTAMLNDDVCDDCDDNDTGGGKNNIPTAFLYRIDPNPAHEFEDITFEGYGEDTDGSIIGYRWESDITNTLSTEATFISSNLQPGIHTITFFVQDNDLDWSNPVNRSLQILENMAPLSPIIAGEIRGKAGVDHDFSLITTDPEGHQVLYYIEWGDGSVAEWIGPYQSDVEVSMTHLWDEQGAYSIKAKAKDVHGAESDWTILEVQMPYAYHQHGPLFDFFVGRLISRFPVLTWVIG